MSDVRPGDVERASKLSETEQFIHDFRNALGPMLADARRPAPSNGKTLPWWMHALFGVTFPAFVAAYLLGMIPGMPSPIAKLQAAMEAHAAADQEKTRIFKVICHAVSRDNPTLKDLCGPVQ